MMPLATRSQTVSERVSPPLVWFRRYQTVSAPQMRLVCFPPAGAGAGFYRQWGRLAPAHLDILVVQYPGREDRIAEPCVSRMPDLADAIAQAVLPHTDLPVALFGHSMGAAVAHEVARRLEQAGVVLSHLFVSGRPPPHRQRPNTIHSRDDAGILSEIARLGGTATAVLDHAELRALLIPPIRNDFRLIETYAGDLDPPLRTPVSAFIGDQDTEVTADEADDWRRITEANFSLRVYPGGHFYLNDQLARLIHDLVSGLALKLWPDTP